MLCNAKSFFPFREPSERGPSVGQLSVFRTLAATERRPASDEEKKRFDIDKRHLGSGFIDQRRKALK